MQDLLILPEKKYNLRLISGQRAARDAPHGDAAREEAAVEHREAEHERDKRTRNRGKVYSKIYSDLWAVHPVSDIWTTFVPAKVVQMEQFIREKVQITEKSHKNPGGSGQGVKMVA